MIFPLFSIVITTKNEELNVEACLKSLKLQTYRNIEIVLIDNNSTDSTVKIAKKYTELVYNLGPERSAQRNFGMLNVAKGKYVMYVDADMLLTPDLVEIAVEQLENTDFVALYLPEIVLGNSLFARVRRFERQFYDGTSIDAARIFRKEILDKSGGFDQELFKLGSGEDWDLDKRIRQFGDTVMLQKTNRIRTSTEIESMMDSNGASVSPVWQGLLHNESDDRLIPYLKKKRYYSSGFSGYIQKWGSSDPDIKRQFGLRYRFFQVFLENSKWRISLKHPIKLLLVFTLKVLVGLSSIGKWHRG
jgi:glycosyltransferase involved in cell wall biosynthesis